MILVKKRLNSGSIMMNIGKKNSKYLPERRVFKSYQKKLAQTILLPRNDRTGVSFGCKKRTADWQDLTTSGFSCDSFFREPSAEERGHRKIEKDLIQESGSEINRKAVCELRKLTGLTWEDLAKLFNVSRRTLHNWASGKPLNSDNEKQLNLLLNVINYVNRGSVDINRHLLLKPLEDGLRPFDMLVAGDYQGVKKVLGTVELPSKPQLKPLSSEAIEARKPFSPEILVDAIQEPVSRKIGRSRIAKSVRGRKK